MSDRDLEGTNQEAWPRPNPTKRRPIPAQHQAILDATHAPNGLLYNPVKCQACGHHICDEGVLLGVLRKKCSACKFPNVQLINRLAGEDELRERVRDEGVSESTPKALFEEAIKDGTAHR